MVELIRLNPDFAEFIAAVKDPATRNLLLALVVKLELLGAPVPSPEELVTATNVRNLNRSVPN